MKDENLIHIKLEYDEALKSKRDLLSSEVSLLKIAKVMRHYRVLRAREMELKLSLLRRIHSLKAEIAKMQQVLPKIKIPAVLQKQLGMEEAEDVWEYPEEASKSIPSSSNEDLEAQLREIQERLNSLQ